jgi:hypothetical protein
VTFNSQDFISRESQTRSASPTSPTRKHQPKPYAHHHVASFTLPHPTSLHTCTHIDLFGVSEVARIPQYSITNGLTQRHLAVTRRKRRRAHKTNHRSGRLRTVEIVGQRQRAGTAVQVQDVQSNLGMFIYMICMFSSTLPKSSSFLSGVYAREKVLVTEGLTPISLLPPNRIS